VKEKRVSGVEDRVVLLTMVFDRDIGVAAATWGLETYCLSCMLTILLMTKSV
jgi:hypothetical protein